ncbi:metallophosphoesterase [Candidatus Woesearchaeota archaeon]|nr:metallophosphoesterase [Nanoarchaeota archaeon]MCB9370627.1 metallophosphoesterase [Candidatus Woesearchaeota archaeon]USN43711.1 MAG: metallophosphoesterase [Candidatus Woesearchaeota archaeon]
MDDKKIRFLGTGDFHSDKQLVKAIQNYVDLKNIDFVLFVGDLSDKNNDFADMFGIFKGKPIFMVPGNHETKSKLKKLEEHYGVHLVGNHPVQVHKDLVIFGTNYLSIGPYGLPEEEIFENLLQNYAAIEKIKCKIQLSHLPPAETEIGEASPFFPMIGGSVAVREFLENFKPDLTLCGHIHESSGLEEIVNKTKLVNVGRTFKVFEFDPKTSKIETVEE